MTDCPQCGKELVVRTNSRDGRQFLGCSGFRNGCRYTQSLSNGQADYRNGYHVNAKKFIPSKEQELIIGDVVNHDGNMIVNASAGSGKSTTAMHSLSVLLEQFPSLKTVYTCFNKAIAVDFAKIAPASTNVSTMHSLGYAMIKQSFPNMKVDGRKTEYILNHLCESMTPKTKRNALSVMLADPDSGAIVQSSLERLVSQAKNHNVNDVESLKALAVRFDIDTRDDKIIPYIPIILEESKHFEKAGAFIIDFDDMIWLPITLGLEFPKPDLTVIDECQDLNPTRQQFAIKLGESGRILAIGDRFQSIYAFCGADTKGMDTLETLLNESKPLSKRTLSFTRRCPKSHVDYINRRYPEIPFHSFPDSPLGRIEDIGADQIIEKVRPNDLILCRVNAPLVALFFKLIKAKVRATIIGKKDDIDALLGAIKGLKAKSIPDLLSKAEKARSRELKRLAASGKPTLHAKEAIDDKYDIIREIASSCSGVSDIEPTIRAMFSEDTKDKVRLSSVHRGKGSEALNTFVLGTSLMPHPKAETEEELEQERNIGYVAFSRCKAVAGDDTTGTMYLIS